MSPSLTPLDIETSIPPNRGDTYGYDGTDWVPTAQLFNVKLWGAKGDGVTDDVPAIQRAIDAITAAGGGVLYFPKGTYKLIATTTVSGLTWHLSVPSDNITITGPGTVSTSVAGAYMFSVGGWLKVGTTWPAQTYADWGSGQPTYYAMSSAAEGATSVTLTTAAQAANFAPGDKCVIRTGQLLASRITEPDAEINEVVSASAITGIVVLKYPLAKAYAQEYFISGTTGLTSTSVTANLATFGIAKVTARTSTNVTFDGLAMAGSSDQAAFITGAGVDGLTIKNCRAIGRPLMSMGNYRNGLIRHNVNSFATANMYGITTATCTSDVLIEDNELANSQEVYQVHLHEGSARVQVRDNRILSAISVADFPTVSVRARAYNIAVRDNLIVNTSASYAVYADSSCTGGGVIEGNTFAGTIPTSVAISAPNWIVGQNKYKGSGAAGVPAVALFEQSTGVVERLNNTVTPGRPIASLGVLPAMSFVTGVFYWVEETFNSSGTDMISVGYSGTEAGIAPATDVSVGGRVAPNLFTLYGFNRQDRALNAYYVAGGTAPTTGKVVVIVTYVRVRDAYS